MVRSFSTKISVFLSICCVIALTACGNNTQQETSEIPDVAGKIMKKAMQETFVSSEAGCNAVASPAVWHGTEGEHWVVAAAQGKNQLIVYNAETGEIVHSIGSAGTGEGQFRTPCGVSIVDNLAVVVEKGNPRAQVFLLPDFQSLGTFGAKDLQNPSGITMYRLTEDRYYIFIADNAADPSNPAAKDAKHVHKYEMNYFEGDFRAAHVASFGDVEGDGVLHESGDIYMDPLNDHLLIVDNGSGQNNIKVYDASGKYTGKTIAKELFKSKPEGIALYEGHGSAGYWILTDQDGSQDVFHILNRKTFEEEGSFVGSKTKLCSGICVSEEPFGAFKKGAVYTVDTNGKVACFPWESIANGLHLKDPSAGIAMR